mmetsp:Transcript_51197/g.111560  ORF Transcript_51197/g.111560 Transcript_51197/m.111560 type:complete len:350 (-) Transcript_51197:122-1171(-)
MPDALAVHCLSRRKVAFGAEDLAGKAPREQHVHALEDVLLVAALDRQHALVPEELGAQVLHERADPFLQLVHVKLHPREGPRDAGHGVVVHVSAWVHVEELGVHLQHTLELEGAQVDQLLRVHLRELRVDDRCVRVDAADAAFQLAQRLLHVACAGRLHAFATGDLGDVPALLLACRFGGRALADQVALVQDDAVCKRNLLDGLVLRALWLLLVQVLHDVRRVHHGDDPVQAVLGLDVVIYEEGLRHWCGIGHACSLDQHGVEELDLVVHALERLNQVAPHRAAYAAVHHLNHLLVDAGHTLTILALARRSSGDQLLIHAHIAELVLDDRKAEAVVRRAKDVVQQSGLA